MGRAAIAEARAKRLLDVLTVASPSRLAPGVRAVVREIRELLAGPEVVGIGLGERAGAGGQGGGAALRLYLSISSIDAGRRLARLVPHAAAGLRGRLDAVPIDLVSLRDLAPPRPSEASFAAGPPLRTSRWLPPAVQPGYAIQHTHGPAGSFGAVVKDRRGHLFALSNCHVLALGGAAHLGDEIDYPGHPGPLGRLVRFIPLRPGGRYSNLVDAAIASFSPGALARLDPRLRGLGCLPAGTCAARRDMAVVKVGLDGVTSISRVVDVNFRAIFDSGSQSFGFRDQVLCHPRFGEDGDSGALVLEQRTRRALALNVAATSDLGASVCCPLRPALATLSVNLLTA